MRTRAIGAMILALVSITTPALAGPDGTFELYNVTINSNGTTGATDFNACEAPVTVLFSGQLGRLSIGLYHRLAGGTMPGISAVELYLEGLEVGTHLPAGWNVSVVLAPGIQFPLGSLVAPTQQGGNTVRRANFTWPVEMGQNDANCQKDSLVFVARVDLQSPVGNPTLPNDIVVSAIAGSPPSNPTFQCPFALLCDNPTFTTFCATGSRFVINPVSESCVNAVRDKSWGAVKELYR